MVSRREVMGGIAVGATLAGSFSIGAPAWAAAGDDAALKTLLDKLAKGGADRLGALRGFSPTNLSPAARLDYDAVLSALTMEDEIVRRFPFGNGPGSPYVVTTRSGAWLRAAEAAKTGDAAAALAKRLDAETAQIAADAAKGVVLPAFVIDKVADGIAAAAKTAESEPDLVAALARQRDGLLTLKGQGGKGIGVSRFKNGEAYYALLLNSALGLTTSPKDQEARAKAAAKVLTARADKLLKAQGLTKGTVGARLAALTKDERFLYSDDDVGRDKLVADMNATLAKAVGRLGASFATVAPGSRNVSISRMTRPDEAAGRQGYREAPAADGGKPGVYYVDLKAIRTRPTWTLPSVVHHEAVAGHMVQMPLEELSGAHPLRTRLACPGFSEGWAIYAEQLADEEGAFQGDPLAELGYLQWMLFRIARVLADFGIHLHGWSAARTAVFLDGLQGPPPVFSPVSQGIERIAIGPTASAGQGLTWLELVRLREDAKKLLGSGFDLRVFHDAVLLPGTLPLAMQRRRLLGA